LSALASAIASVSSDVAFSFEPLTQQANESLRCRRPSSRRASPGAMAWS